MLHQKASQLKLKKNRHQDSANNKEHLLLMMLKETCQHKAEHSLVRQNKRSLHPLQWMLGYRMFPSKDKVLERFLTLFQQLAAVRLKQNTGNAQSNGPDSTQKLQYAQRPSVQTDIDIPNEIDQSSATATRTVSSSSGSAVQDNNSTNTYTVTNQQSAEHTDQVNFQTAQQTSHRTVMEQETQQHAASHTVKRRPSSYEIPSTASIQKLKSRT